MAVTGNKNNLSSLDTGYDDLDPTFYTGFAYSPDGGSGEAASDYYGRPVSTAQPTSTLASPDWPVVETFSPLSSVSYLPAADYTSPGLMMDTDSESDRFSPIDAPPGLDPLTGRWPWTQPSGPFLGPGLTPSSTQAPLATTTSLSKSSKSKAQSKLRTASRRPRKSARSSQSTSSPSEADAAADDAISPEELRARKNHNLVEKQYRNRLNAQFERLLAVLPANQRRGPGEGEDDKRMSKAEVLDVATRRIQELELERRRLQKERRDLIQTVEMMNGVAKVGVPRR